MKEPIFVTRKPVRAIQYTGDNIEYVDIFVREFHGIGFKSLYGSAEKGVWIYENVGFNGDKYVSLCRDDDFNARFKICEAPREKEESPACSPHTGFKVVDKKNKSANYIDDALSVLWGLKNHRMALYPDKEQLKSTFIMD